MAYAVRDAQEAKAPKRGNSTLVKNRNRGGDGGAVHQDSPFVIPPIGHVSTFSDLHFPSASPELGNAALGIDDGSRLRSGHEPRREDARVVDVNRRAGYGRTEIGRRVNSDGVSVISSLYQIGVHFVPSGEWVAGWSGPSAEEDEHDRIDGNREEGGGEYRSIEIESESDGGEYFAGDARPVSFTRIGGYDGGLYAAGYRGREEFGE